MSTDVPQLENLVKDQTSRAGIRRSHAEMAWLFINCKRQTKCMDDVFAAQAAGVRSAIR